MARGKFITEFELDLIRIGVATGHSDGQIARFMGRSRVAVLQQRRKMEKAGTLGNLPLPFVSEEIAQAIDEAQK